MNVCLFFHFSQILEETADKYKVHWVGWGKQYDSWVEKQDTIDKTDAEDKTDDDDTFWSELRTAIKRRLKLGPKDSAEVVFRLAVQEIQYQKLLNVTHEKEGRRRYFKNEDLCSLLEDGWNLRHINEIGDFCCVADDSFNVSLCKERKYSEYIYNQQEGRYELRKYPSSGLIMTVRFVRLLKSQDDH